MRAPRLSLLMFAVLSACTLHCSPIPNASMTAPPGPLARAFQAAHVPEAEVSLCDPDDGAGSSGISEISIERTPCYGFCATYTLTFRSNGEVEYDGAANVPRTGTRRGKLAPDQFRYLASLALAIHYFELKDRYECAVTDNPTVYTRVVRGTESKLIRHYAPNMNGPALLRAFEEAVDAAEEWVDWQGR